MITLFKSITDTTPLKYISFDDFFQLLSDHQHFSPRIREYAKSDKSKYQEIKKKLPCFCIGKFEKRKDSNLLEYSGIMGFDIDKLNNPLLYDSVFSKLKSIEYVYAAFPSVSKQGLRVLIKTNSLSEHHKQNYQEVYQKLNSDLANELVGEAYLDPSTKNASRAWYYEYLDEGELYKNESSIEFTGSNKNSQQTDSTNSAKTLSENTILNLCNALIQERSLKGRNDQVMQFTRLASEYGASLESILKHCYSLIDNSVDNKFSKEEIDRTVKNNFKNYIRPESYLIGQFKKKFGYKALQEIKTEDLTLSNQEIKNVISKNEKKSNKFEKIKEFVTKLFRLRFNVISKKLEISSRFQTEVEEVNLHDIECKLYENGFSGFTQILNAIAGSNDHVEKFNPLVEFLKNLPQWDPTEKDYISELASYVETDDDEFFKVQFKKMLVRNLACSLERIDFNKQVFTFVGEQQNLGKTTFLRKLIPDQLCDYYKEEINLSDKDSLKSLATDLFIILDEIHSYNSKELSKLKAWISKKIVKLRLPYRKDDMTARRIANFFATSNDENFLTDTQNVRWLIFKIIKINHDYGGANGYEQNIKIDDVYSQALYLLNDPNFDCQLTKEELIKMEKRNTELFSKQSSEEELILKYFDNVDTTDMDSKSKKEFFKTATEIYEILKLNHPSLKCNTQKIGIALTKLRFEKGKQRINGSDPKSGYYLKKREISLLHTTNDQNGHF